MGDPAWSPGVVGIVASRIQQEIQYAPVVIFSIDEKNGTARGSARSIPGFDIHAALARCADILLKWGGHKAAAGLSIRTGQIAEFADRFEQIAQEHPEEVFTSCGKIDMELPLQFVGFELLEALHQLEPHGMGNPSPLFAVRKTPFTLKKTFGKENNHVKLGFHNGVEGIFWRGAGRLSTLSPEQNGPLDIVFHLVRDNFSGCPVLDIRDVGRFF